MEPWPSDSEYLEKEIGSLLASTQPASKNYNAGNPVKDWENQNYRNTDPSAGTGDGAHSEPQKIEVL